MSRTGAIAAVCILGLLAVPTAVPLQEQPVVAGHATYSAMDGLDPCIAGVVGIVRLRVMWFNDQVLFERAAADGASWVYAVEHAAPDPRDKALLPTGEVFEFDDPNGVPWRIVEYLLLNGAAASGGNASVSNATSIPPNPQPHVDPPSARDDSWHVWVVQIGPTTDDFAATGRPYNFVNLVDTCKFRGATGELHHGRENGNWTTSDPHDTTKNHHFADDAPHNHRAYSVDLYLGSEPIVAAPPQEQGYLGEVS